MKIVLFLLLLIFAGIIPANFIWAANPLDVVISEISWMGTETHSTDEWIELYNNTTSIIDITDWTLKSNDDSPSITFETKIESKTEGGRVSSCFLVQGNGFYLLERTDDDTIIDIPADYIYTGALNNNGETLELRDTQGNLIDAVDFANGWLFGDNATKQTMERKKFLLAEDADNWQTSATPGGTPLAQNSIISHSEQSEESLSTEPANGQLSVINNQSNDQSLPEPQTIEYPNGVTINEILPSPDGPDAENEWIEIFNKNDFSIDISNWEIADTQGKTKSYFFPQNTIIKAKSFLLFPRPRTKITLNNDADGLNLIHPNGTITHSVVYAKAKLNQSYNRIIDNWVWSDTLTPGWENIVPSATDNIKENSVSNADERYNNDNNNATTVNFFTNKNSEFFAKSKPIHFTASLLALFSAFSILALKRSITKR
jgi:hypothetical protein